MFPTAFLSICHTQIVEIWPFDFSTNRQTNPQTVLPIKAPTRSLKNIVFYILQ